MIKKSQGKVMALPVNKRVPKILFILFVVAFCVYLVPRVAINFFLELEEIVNAGVALGNNEYANLSEYTFHSKLYEITGNKTIVQFQSIIHPVMNFVKTNLRERVEAINIELEKKGKIVTHTDLLNFIKNKDEMGYRNAIEQHFYVYKKLIYDRAVLGEQNKGQSQ